MTKMLVCVLKLINSPFNKPEARILMNSCFPRSCVLRQSTNDAKFYHKQSETTFYTNAIWYECGCILMSFCLLSTLKSPKTFMETVKLSKTVSKGGTWKRIVLKTH